VNRVTAFYWLATIGLCGPQLVSALDQFLHPGPEHFRPSTPTFKLFGGGTVIAVLLLLLLPPIRCIRMDKPWLPEPAAGEFIAAEGLNGKLLAYFDWGEYAIWHFPRLQVSIDGRRETVYSEDLQTAHLNFFFGNRTTLPDELGADYVWVPEKLPVVNRLVKAGWVDVFRGPVSVVLARGSAWRGSRSIPPRPERPFHDDSRCFPGW
jgi:hypothetical protein